MAKPKPYCARTLRHVSATLRKQARVTRGYPGAFPGQSGFTRANIYDGLADTLLHKAQAIEKEAKAGDPGSRMETALCGPHWKIKRKATK